MILRKDWGTNHIYMYKLIMEYCNFMLTTCFSVRTNYVHVGVCINNVLFINRLSHMYTYAD